MLCSQRNCLVIAFAAVCATVGAAQPASSADLGSAPSAPPVATPSSWTISVTPYGWLPFLNGDATVRGRTAEIDVNPREVLEHLDAIPWMSYIEARRGPLSFYNDIFVAKLGIDVGGARTLGGATLDATLGLDFNQTIIEVGGTYEIAKWWSGGSSRITAIDLLAGARYWHQEMDINLALTGTLSTSGLVLTGGRAIARSGNVDWVDPVIGGRVRHQLAPGQELVLRGDIGGFDVGSRFSWNVLGAYSWHIADRDGVSYAGILGYRLLSVDYEKGSGLTRYEYDVLQHGPLMGLTLSF
jgi:hypothetical protein